MTDNTKYVVYKHTSPSGKSYIGLTKNLTARNKSHLDKTSQCVAFKHAIQKYGWDNFTHEVLLDELTIESANYWEEYYIREYNSLAPGGYNLQTGGNSRKHTEETKRKMTQSKLRMSDETKQKISAARLGVPHSECTKQKMRKPKATTVCPVCGTVGSINNMK